MKEYIDREAVKDEILSWAVCINHPELLSKEDTIYLIDSLPAADVAEVRHGHWIDHHSGGSFCSACKRWVPYNHHPKYCETCGARMDGQEDEHEAD